MISSIVRRAKGDRNIASSFLQCDFDLGSDFRCPVFVNDADREWVVDPDLLRILDGETKDILPGITIYRLGGHFPGSAVLHWVDRQALFPGDTILVALDRKHVSFMWSYPNNVPLPAADLDRIGEPSSSAGI